MSFRRHVITGEPILFAPGRAARPHAFTGDATADERCPFCPGHEGDTPAEIGRIAAGAAGGAPAGTGGAGGRDARTPWLARVFPNKYPPIAGAEVIVESPDHQARFDAIEHAEQIVRLYAERYRAHGAAAYTAIFKNEGAAAGSSLEHVHSQVVPVPFVPQRIERELAAFARGGCPLCAELENVIRETESFRWIAPSGSWMAYQQWLVPKRHVAEITAFTDGELAELSALLRAATAGTTRIAGAFNWAFINFPRGANAHAYVDVLPRMTTIAGFELGTGTFVEIIDPAAAAETLRTVLRP